MQHFFIFSAMPFLLKMMRYTPKNNHSSIRSPTTYSLRIDVACQVCRPSVKAPSSSDVLPDSTPKAVHKVIADRALSAKPLGTALGVLEEQTAVCLSYERNL